MSQRCRSCGAAIVWVLTQPANKRMPVDEQPVANGNLWLQAASTQTWAHYVTKDKPAPDGERLYVSHFVTCPQAKQHRRKSERDRAV